jgi:hypothetical protein
VVRPAPDTPQVYWVGRTPFGPRSGINFANNVYDWRSYDQDGRITGLETEVGSGTSIDLIHWTYAYSDKRNLTGTADVLSPADSELYMYADNGFLESAVGPWGTPVAASTSLYSLVSGSNRLSGVTTDGTPSRQLDSDAAGNVVEDTDLSTSTIKDLAYNHAGQLTGFEIGGVAQGIYKHDHLSLLASRELPGSPTTLHYVHDRDGNVIAEYDSVGTLLREYVWLDAGRSPPSGLGRLRTSTLQDAHRPSRAAGDDHGRRQRPNRARPRPGSHASERRTKPGPRVAQDAEPLPHQRGRHPVQLFCISRCFPPIRPNAIVE